MSKNILEALFESKTRLKMLKFLFRNYGSRYSVAEITNHTQESVDKIRKEIKNLLSINLINKAGATLANYGVNTGFEYFAELRDLMLKSTPWEKKRLVEKMHKLGKIKLAVIAGVFLDKENNDPLAVDLFLVHDYLDKRKFGQFLKNVEAEIGTDIRFATMDKEEFKYRFAMFDRFVRVLLESPHEKLINKLGI